MTHTGAELIAQTISKLGVDTVFGLVGIPVVEVADELIKIGVKFISFRNEQSASYAASAYGYLTGRPAVLLVVGGPGIVHAAAGIINSQANRWPLLVLAGSTSGSETYRGGFQELDQVNYISSNVKFSGRPRNISYLPFLIQKSYKVSLVGVPGATYVDLPADIIQAEIDDDIFTNSLAPINDYVFKFGAPKFVADPSKIAEVAKLIQTAKSPLVVIGKGASYSDSSAEVRNFVNTHKLAFLPTPMGKGVVEDSSPLNTSSARSTALKEADVVILLGARLNWILHHGDTPRFKDNVKFVQIDISNEDVGENRASGSYNLALVGDIELTLKELTQNLRGYRAPALNSSLLQARDKNVAKAIEKEQIKGSEVLLNYNQVYKILKDGLAAVEDDLMYVIEGANTMDIARVLFESNSPKNRLDAGTNATMGVGLGYAIASKLANPQKLVVAIEGDSAFGFSAMELETITRFKLAMIIVVMNNSGVYHGIDPKNYHVHDFKMPSTALSHNVKYDLLAKSLGAEGVCCQTPYEIAEGLKFALSNYKQGKTTLLNVIIEPGSDKKLEFGWQNKKKSSKL